MRWPLALAIVVVALSSCASALDRRLGSVSARGGLLGQLNVVADRCSSGIMNDSSGQTVVLSFGHHYGRGGTLNALNIGILNGKVTLVEVQKYNPYRTLQIDGSQCARFVVQPRPIQPNGNLGADVEIDCETGDGGHVTASLHAGSCS